MKLSKQLAKVPPWPINTGAVNRGNSQKSLNILNGKIGRLRIKIYWQRGL